MDTTSRDSEDISQYFRNEENSTPMKRRKTKLVRREISYDCDHEAEKGNSVEYPVSDYHSYDDSLTSGSPKLLSRPFGFSLINSRLMLFIQGAPTLCTVCSRWRARSAKREWSSTGPPDSHKTISAYTPSYSPVRPPHPTSSTDQSNRQPSKKRMKPLMLTANRRGKVSAALPHHASGFQTDISPRLTGKKKETKYRIAGTRPLATGPGRRPSRGPGPGNAPARSRPGPANDRRRSVARASAARPEATRPSRKLTPRAATAIRTCPKLETGRAILSSAKPAAPP